MLGDLVNPLSISLQNVQESTDQSAVGWMGLAAGFSIL